MGKIEDLQQLVQDTQSAVDALQTRIATKLSADAQTIQDLKDIIAAGEGTGATDEQLEAVIASLTSSRDDLAATPDV